MTKNLINALFLSLLAVVTVACGDAGGAPIEGEGGLGEVLAGEQNADDNDVNVDEEQNEDDANVEEDEGEEADDENEQDEGDENVDDEEPETVEAEGEVSIDLVIDSLISNEAPAEDSCTGAIAIQIDNGAIAGEGRCFLDTNANFLDYVLDADVDADGTVEGEIDVLLNGRSNVLVIEGSLTGGVLSLEFGGVTLVTQNIRAVWNGTVEADFD